MPKYKKYPGVVKQRNKWYYRIQYNRQRKWSIGYITAEAAYKARIKHLNEVYEKKITPNNITLEQLIRYYLEHHTKANNRVTTLAKDEGIYRNHIIPVMGGDLVQALTPIRVEDFIDYIRKNKTKSTAHNTARCLRKVLRYAFDMNIIAVSPFRSKVPPCPKSKYPVCTPKQLFHIIDNLEGKDRYIVASAGYAGLRRSEVAGLQKKDFFEKEMLTADGYKTYYFLNLQRQVVDGYIITNVNDEEVLKSESSQTIHPLWSHYYKMMITEWFTKTGSSKWVFVGRDGKSPISIGSWVEKRWPKIKERFDIPRKMRYHDLRATYSSILLAEGATPADVSDLMRHSSIEMTLKHYRHTFPGQLEKNFCIFNNLYSNLSGQQSGQQKK